ncbi:hypothetical protein [Tomitella gaofuii]|uniref:hypothetical protein n=1 Tax=Tomitella gaofuii TaxID=2760083 RepID=UPI0015F916AC|nr:hypothetical protein [Tomitella gaofuii]
MAIPPLDFETPLLPPAGGGLVGAATLIDRPTPSRLAGGVHQWPTNCDVSAGVWPAIPCADTTGLEKSGDRGTGDTFPATVVWGYDECDPGIPDETVMARADHNRQLAEPALLEAVFAERALADAGTPTVAAGFVDAVSRLEAALADTGLVGVLHATPAAAAWAQHYGLIIRNGQRLRTPLGHIWSFGPGYVLDTGVLFATGPVTIHRDAPTTRVSVDADGKAAVSERTLVASYECLATAVQITTGDGAQTLFPGGNPGQYPGVA